MASKPGEVARLRVAATTSQQARAPPRGLALEAACGRPRSRAVGQSRAERAGEHARAGGDRRANAVSRPRAKQSGDSPVALRARPLRASSSATAPPSELPATCGRRPIPDRSHELPHGIRERGERDLAGQRGGCAEARQVERDDVALAAKALEHRAPDLPLAADPVDEDERLAGPLPDVVEHTRTVAVAPWRRTAARQPADLAA